MTYECHHTVLVRVVHIYDVVSEDGTQKQQLTIVKVSVLIVEHVIVNGFKETSMDSLEARVGALWEGNVRMDLVSV